jgi:hypothetical protein
MTPKGRRLHLIQSHGYPKQFFFSVTNKGIGGLLHKWGQGASLYRDNWRSRVQGRDMERGSENKDETRSESGTGSEMDVEDDQHKVNGKQKGGDLMDNSTEIMSRPSTNLSPPSARPHASGSPESDMLANVMSSLTLVPDKIRFGRGGKKGGFGHPHPAKPAQTGRVVHPELVQNNIDEKVGDQKLFQGRGGRRRTAQCKASDGTSSLSGKP